MFQRPLHHPQGELITFQNHLLIIRLLHWLNYFPIVETTWEALLNVTNNQLYICIIWKVKDIIAKIQVFKV